jgi:ribosomal protein L12E/L44/L45/RPP1/RPP2
MRRLPTIKVNRFSDATRKRLADAVGPDGTLREDELREVLNASAAEPEAERDEATLRQLEDAHLEA